MKTILLILITMSLCFTPIQAQSYPEFIKVTGGTFTMGDERDLGYEDEQPTHRVTLTDYYIGKTEVTVGQYYDYCKDTGEKMPTAPSWGWITSDPMVSISWQSAIDYCDWLSDELDRNITLPTEAQWEFAARGGNQSKGYKYAGGRSMPTVGWCRVNSNSKPHAVATKKANELGLYDMSGNVQEWCFDWYSADYYATSPSENPKNMEWGNYSKRERIARGGNYRDEAFSCRTARRTKNAYDRPSWKDIGFRVVSF